MAIATTIQPEGRNVFGNKRVIVGRSVLSGSVATGEVVTGLNKVEAFFIQVVGAAQQGSSVDETFPLAGGTVTALVETNDSTFDWIAIGI